MPFEMSVFMVISQGVTLFQQFMNLVGNGGWGWKPVGMWLRCKVRSLFLDADLNVIIRMLLGN